MRKLALLSFLAITFVSSPLAHLSASVEPTYQTETREVLTQESPITPIKQNSISKRQAKKALKQNLKKDTPPVSCDMSILLLILAILLPFIGGLLTCILQPNGKVWLFLLLFLLLIIPGWIYAIIVAAKNIC